MTEQFYWLLAALILAIIQIMVAARSRVAQTGIAYQSGPRDEQHTYTGTAPRLARAQANLYETLPLFIATILIAHIAGRDGALNLWGARLYVIARIIYLPAYGAGWSARSLIWVASMIGLVLTFIPLF